MWSMFCLSCGGAQQPVHWLVEDNVKSRTGFAVWVPLGVSDTVACQAGRVKIVQERKELSLVWS